MAGNGCQNALFTMLIQFLGVKFVAKIFSIIRCRSDLENFRLMCARTSRSSMFEPQ